MEEKHEIGFSKEELHVGQAGFYAKAVLKGLELLCGISITLRELVDTQKKQLANSQSQLKALTPAEACEVLQVSKNKLNSMKEKGVLIEDVHYFQDESTVRYHPNLATVFIERELDISPNKRTKNDTDISYADKQAAKQHTKYFYKN